MKMVKRQIKKRNMGVLILERMPEQFSLLDFQRSIEHEFINYNAESGKRTGTSSDICKVFHHHGFLKRINDNPVTYRTTYLFESVYRNHPERLLEDYKKHYSEYRKSRNTIIHQLKKILEEKNEKMPAL